MRSLDQVHGASPPYVWTPTRYRRVEMLHLGEEGTRRRFRTICWLCGLPSVQLKPAGKGRTWCAHCTCCGAMTFVLLPPTLYAPTQLMWGPHQRSLEDLGDFVKMLVAYGGEQMKNCSWAELTFGTKRRIELDERQACLGCGEEASVSIRRDKHGLPYTICSACRNRTFLRSEHCMFSTMGWTRWLRQGNEDIWIESWNAGRAQWKTWLDVHRLDDAQSSESSSESERNRETG